MASELPSISQTKTSVPSEIWKSKYIARLKEVYKSKVDTNIDKRISIYAIICLLWEKERNLATMLDDIQRLSSYTKFICVARYGP